MCFPLPCPFIRHSYSSTLNQGVSSHKKIPKEQSWILRQYYGNNIVLFLFCACNELFFVSIYLLSFPPPPNSPPRLGISLTPWTYDLPCSILSIATVFFPHFSLHFFILSLLPFLPASLAPSKSFFFFFNCTPRICTSLTGRLHPRNPPFLPLPPCLHHLPHLRLQELDQCDTNGQCRQGTRGSRQR